MSIWGGQQAAYNKGGKKLKPVETKNRLAPVFCPNGSVDIVVIITITITITFATAPSAPAS